MKWYVFLLILLFPVCVWTADSGSVEMAVVSPSLGLAGGIAVEGVSLQTTTTFHFPLDAGTIYGGLFTNYSVKEQDFTEISPFLGRSFKYFQKAEIDTSLILVHDGNSVAALAGRLVGRYTMLHRPPWKADIQVTAEPQWVSGLRDGMYMTASLPFVRAISPTASVQFEPMVVYDTGAYSEANGFNKRFSVGFSKAVSSSATLKTDLVLQVDKSNQVQSSFSTSINWRW